MSFRTFDIETLSDGRVLLAYQFYNTNVGLPDGNFSVATQSFGEVRPLTPTPRLVNPDGEAENTSQNFSTVALADGRYVSFFSLNRGWGGQICPTVSA